MRYDRDNIPSGVKDLGDKKYESFPCETVVIETSGSAVMYISQKV